MAIAPPLLDSSTQLDSPARSRIQGFAGAAPETVGPADPGASPRPSPHAEAAPPARERAVGRVRSAARAMRVLAHREAAQRDHELGYLRAGLHHLR